MIVSDAFSTRVTQFAPFPVGTRSIKLSVPVAWSIAYSEIFSDFCPDSIK
jgi:hypothetical protein